MNNATKKLIEFARDSDDVKELNKILLEKEVDINGAYEDMKRPLIQALYAGNLKVAEALINAGADILEHDYYRRTPLQISIRENAHEITELLQKKLKEQGE